MPNQYLRGTIAIPSSLDILAITRAIAMVVTCVVNPVTESNTYIPGMLVRLTVPSSYGMYQANGLTGQIIFVSGLNFTLNIDSSQFDPFVVPAITDEQPSSMAPAGSKNLTFNNTTSRVGFQSLNNQGN